MTGKRTRDILTVAALGLFIFFMGVHKRLMVRKSRYNRIFLSALCAASFSGFFGLAHAQDAMLPPDFLGGPQQQELPSARNQELPPPVVPAGQSPLGSQASPGMELDPGSPFGAMTRAEPPKTPAQLEAEIREESFNAALSGLLPLRPKEIRKLLEYYDQTQEAVEVPVYPYPKPEVSVINISLDPGVTPPVIKVAPGHVTTLNILDVTGAPWPIQDVTWAGNFEIVEPEEGGHIVRITPMSEFAYGNLSMRLLTLKTPVTFTLRSQRDVVHYRVDGRLPEFGPFANAPLIEGGISLVAGDASITTILDGLPPQGAVKLQVSGVDGRTTAYRFRNRTYVRTPLQLLSPGWDESVSSADGMNVYALANTPVLILSDSGRMMRAHLNQEDVVDE